MKRLRTDCNLDCLHCIHDKCLDEMSVAERRKAKQLPIPPSETAEQVIDGASEILRETSSAAMNHKKSTAKNKERAALYYQQNKEKIRAQQKEYRKRKKSGKEAEEVAEEKQKPEMAAETIEEEKTMVSKEVAEGCNGEEKEIPRATEAADPDGTKEYEVITLRMSKGKVQKLRELIEDAVQFRAENGDFSGMEWLADMCEIWKELRV